MAKLILKNGEEKTINGTNIILQANGAIKFKLDNEPYWMIAKPNDIIKSPSDITLKSDTGIVEVVYFVIGA